MAEEPVTHGDQCDPRAIDELVEKLDDHASFVERLTGQYRTFTRRVLLVLALIGAVLAFLIAYLIFQDNQNQYDSCGRGNELRDTIRDTFDDVIAARDIPQSQKDAVTEALSPLTEGKRDCGDDPFNF